MVRNKLVKNIASILWAIWRRRYLIAIPILIMPIAGLVVGILSPKKYETYTTLLFQEASESNPFLEDLAIATNLKARMEALNALLHSRHILASVAWKMELLQVNMDEKEKSKIISDLSQALNAKLVGENLIKITYHSPQKAKMVETLNMVSMHFVDRVLAPQRSSIVQSESFLAKELEERRSDLEKAERAMADYQDKFASELPSLHVGNVSRLSELEALIAQRHIELDGARAAQRSLASRLAQTNPVVGKIEEAIIVVMAELTQLRARYTDEHSKVQAALARLSALETERNNLMTEAQAINPDQLDQVQIERLWAIAASSSNNSNQEGENNSSRPLLISQLERLQHGEDQIQRLTKEISTLTTEIDNLQNKVNGFGKHEQNLNELKREIDAREKIYKDLAERYERARVTGSLGKSEEQDRVKLIDPPFEPLGPITLPVFVFVIAGIAGGVALGIGLAIIAELLDTSIRRKDILIQMLNVPVLARIPPLQPADKQEIPS